MSAPRQRTNPRGLSVGLLQPSRIRDNTSRPSHRPGDCGNTGGVERARWRAVVVTAAAVLALALPSAAHANAPITAFSVTPSTTQAGGHPDLDTLIEVGNRDTQNLPKPNCKCEDAKNLIINLPTGLIGDPHAAPQCSAADFATITCPVESQVGVEEIGVQEETYARRAESLLEAHRGI